MKRVLVYTPYGYWHLHTLYEVTVGHALRLRGADVKFICCNGIYSDCDVAWKAVRPRDENTCVQCIGRTQQLFTGMQMPFEWISAYLGPEDAAVARELATTTARTRLRGTVFNGDPIGEWIASSVHSHFRADQLDFEDSEVETAFRSYLYGGALAHIALTRALDSYTPDAAFLFNGRLFSHRIFLELAKQRGVHVVVHERGFTPEALSLYENATCHQLEGLSRNWETWKHIPLTTAELNAAHTYLMGRESGSLGIWQSKFVKGWASRESLPESAMRRQLGVPPGRKIIALFNSCEDESAYLAAEQNIIDQREWIERSIAFFTERSDYQLVIRVHPNIAGITGANQEFLRWITAFKASEATQNITVILPNEPINSYVLLRLSELCLTFGSTLSLEATVRGRQSVIVKKGFYYEKGFGISLPQGTQYEALLEGALVTPVTDAQLRMAYRFAYRMFLAKNVPFPLIKMDGVHDATPNYTTTEALLPGRDPGLDFICDALLNKAPIYPLPTNEHTRGAEEEDAFLAALVHHL